MTVIGKDGIKRSTYLLLILSLLPLLLRRRLLDLMSQTDGRPLGLFA